MQDYFCPRCGRRMPEGHCGYCENRKRRMAGGQGAGAGKRDVRPTLTEEKVIPFESIKDSGSENKSRVYNPGGRKQDIVLEFVDLESGGSGEKTGGRGGRAKKKTTGKTAKAAAGKTGNRISRWFAERLAAARRIADELINPEEE